MEEGSMRKSNRRANGEGSVAKIKGCQYFYACFYHEGRQRKVSTHTTVKSEALAMLRKMMGNSDNGQAPVSKKLRYADLRQMLIDSYVAKGNKSLKSLADGSETIAGLTELDEFCGYKTAVVDGKLTVTDKGLAATALTTEAAKKFVRQRRDDVGNSAINRSLSCLRRMLNLAKREKKIHDVPFIEFQKEPPPRTGFVEQADFDRLLALLPTHLRPLVTLLYYCGTRVGQALKTEWSHVDFKTRLIRFEGADTKNDEAQILPMPSILADMLKGVTPKSGRVFDGTNLRKSWMAACAAAGLGTIIKVEGKPYDPRYEGLTLHDLRRSAVRNLVNAGVPERVAMKITGHKTRSVFDRYHIVSSSDVTNAMAAVESASLHAPQQVLNGTTLRNEKYEKTRSHETLELAANI
jgi:integrase